MVRFYLPLFLIFAAGIAGSFVGCDGTENEGAREGRLQVWLKDSPSQDFDEVLMTVDRVEIIGYGNDGQSTLLVLDDQPQQYKLALDGATSLLIDAPLPRGRYDQLRLVVRDGADVIFLDGTRRSIPVGSDAGLKVVVPSIVIGSADDVVRMTIDLNIEDSFVQLGSGSEYSFTPMLRADELVVNGETVDVETSI